MYRFVLFAVAMVDSIKYNGANMNQITLQSKKPVVLQILPALISGGVERGTVDMAAYIAGRGWTCIVASAGGPMVYEVERLGVRHIALPLDSKNPLQIYQNGKALAQIIRDFNVDIVHARSRAPAWSAYRAAEKTGAHFVTSFHGIYSFNGRIKKWYNGIMTRGERVIAVSKFVKHHIVGHYQIEAKKIDVVPRGIDFTKFDPTKVHPDRMIKLATEWRIPDDRPIILLPGRISRWKGQRELLAALSEMRDKKFFCLFLGSDHGHESYRKEIEKLVVELQLEGMVKWAGECRDMPAAYCLADVVVSASTEPEAFGRVVVEAQAMGRPVVASDHGGSAETIIDAQTGWLYPPHNIPALRKTLTKVLALNNQARERYAVQSIAHVRAHYGKEQMCRGEFAVYEKVLGANVAAKAA